MNEALSVRCPECESEISVSRSQEGNSVACLSCGKSFLLQKRRAAGKSSSKSGSLPGSTSKQNNLTKFGRFELHQVVGEGAFGRVYRAFDPQLERFVALKIPTFPTTDLQRVARFLDEAKTAGRLRHPNIVPTFESGKQGQQLYIVSQYIDGHTLSQHQNENELDIAQTALMVETIANALHYAHGQGIVHRDIKPDNIMIDREGQPQVMDFGLAKRMDRPNLTRAGKIIGTPAYMSPEQARGEVAVSASSDQYSLGAVFYELLTGQRPFDGDYRAVIVNVSDESKLPPSPRSINPFIPRDLDTICQKTMSKSVEHRYEDCGDLARDLARWRMQLPVTARRIGFSERFVRFTKRNPLVSALIGVLVAAFATTLFLFQRNVNLMREVGINKQSIHIQRKELADLELERSKVLDEIQRKDVELGLQKLEVESKTRELNEITERKLAADALLAEMERKVAVANTAVEESERERLKFKADAAQHALQKRVSQYISSLRLASSRQRMGDLKGASEALGECDPELTHWEWRYLTRKANTIRWTRDGSNGILETCFSPDGNMVAVCRDRSGISILDATNGQLIAELVNSAPRKSRYIPFEQRGMHFSESGRYLISRTWQIKSYTSQLDQNGRHFCSNRIWNLENGAVDDLAGMHATFIGDSHYALTVRLNHSEQVFRPDTENSVIYSSVNVGHASGNMPTVANKPSGTTIRMREVPDYPIRFFGTDQQLAEVRYDRKGRKIEFYQRVKFVPDSESTRYELVALNSPNAVIPVRLPVDLDLCDVSADESVFAYVSGGALKLWNAAARRHLASVEVGKVNSISLNQNGSELCISEDKKIKVHLIPHREQKVIELDVGDLAIFHPRKREVLVADGTSLRLHQLPRDPLKTGQQVVNDFAVSPIENILVAGGANGTIIGWDLDNTEERYRVNTGHGEVTAICFFGSGDRLATGGEDNKVQIWNAKTGVPESVQIDPGNLTGGIRSIAIEESSSQVAIVDGFGNASVCSLKNGRLIASKSPNGRPAKDPLAVNGITWFRSDKQTTAILSPTRLYSGERRFELWSIDQDGLGKSPTLSEATTLAVCPLTQRVACGYESGRVLLWSPNDRSQSVIGISDLSQSAITSLAFHPDGSRLAISTGGSIKLIDAQEGTELITLQDSQVKFARIRFGHEGNMLIASEVGNDTLHVLDGSSFD